MVKPKPSELLKKTLERERLEALVAEIRALRDGGGPSGPPAKTGKKRPKPWLVGLDVAVLLIVVYALITGTPLGSLMQQGWAWVTDSRSDVRPLLSYFSQPSLTKGRLAPLKAALRRVRQMRRRAPTDDPLPSAVAFLLSEDNEGRHFDVRLGKFGQRALRSVAVTWPGEAAPAKQRAAALFEALSRLRQHLGADEAAVAALAVDPDSLAFALERAKASGDRDPATYASFSHFLTFEERRRAGALVHASFALSGAYAMAWPVKKRGPITSAFGPRIHPLLGERRLHKGVDIGVPVGTPVRAAQSGEVTFAGSDAVNGRYLRIDHGHGLTSTYCHLDRHLVQRGEQVERGQPVAHSGNSGRSTGPHLHFQLEFGGTPVDPELFR